MNQQRIRMGKPMRLFVYLPVYLAEKKPGRPPADGIEPVLQKIVIQDKMQFTARIEVGDSFVIRKRDNLKEFLDNKDELKVEQVKYNFIDGSCMVILEKLVFSTKEGLTEFVKNKRSV